MFESQTAAVANEIRALLARQGKTKRALAQELGMHEQSLWRRLQGQTPISVDELVIIAKFLEVEASTLLAAGRPNHDEPPAFRHPVASAA